MKPPIRLGPRSQVRDRHYVYYVGPWPRRPGEPARATVTSVAYARLRNQSGTNRTTHLVTRLDDARWLCSCGRHRDCRPCHHVAAWRDSLEAPPR